VTSADMNIADVNKRSATRTGSTTRFSAAEFHSTDLRREGKATSRTHPHAEGVKQGVVVPFTWAASADGAVIEGELVLKREVFGIGLASGRRSDTIGADVR